MTHPATRILAVLLLALPALAQTIPGAERAALVALYEATGGPSWKVRERWLTGASPCAWAGVACERKTAAPGEQDTAHVVILSLPANGLRGELPPQLADLSRLRVLDLRHNALTGRLPEGFLERWDRHELELSASGNRFANTIAGVRVEVTRDGADCDDGYIVELAEDGKARYESLRCGPGEAQPVLVREGRSPSLMRLGRALKRIGFERLAAEYSNPFSSATHKRAVRATIRFGDGSVQTLASEGEQGPIEAWLAERAVLGLVQEVVWEKESRRKGGE